MNFARFLQDSPLLRPLLALIGGILAADALERRADARLLLPLLAAVAVAGIVLLLLFYIQRGRRPHLFGLGALLLVAAAAMGLTHLRSRSLQVAWPQGKALYRVTLCDRPRPAAGSLCCPAQVTLCADSLGTRPLSARVNLYLYYNYAANRLRAGDQLDFWAAMRPPHNSGNPGEFDYARYLAVKGVSGSCYLYAGNWRITGHHPPGLRARAMQLRDRMAECYRRWGFSGERLALLSAITLGARQQLDEEVRQRFASAGAAHLLALSGLHLGILYLFLPWLLPAARYGTGRRVGLWNGLRTLLIVSVLWGFAFLVGLTPSVVRAALLFTLLGVARGVGRESASLNSWALAALLMLLADPALLFDAGFTLSFAAVLAILLLQPPLFSLLPDGCSPLLRWLWTMVTLSVAAQVGTLPLVLCYFSSLPLYSLLTNLLAVPLLMLLLCGALLMWLLAPLPWLHGAAVWAMQRLLSLLGGWVGSVASLPGASLALPRVWALQGLLVAMVAAFFFLWLLRRWNRGAVWALLSLVLLAATAVWRDAVPPPRPQMIFYNSPACPALQLVSPGKGGESWLVTPHDFMEPDDTVARRLRYVVAPFVRAAALPAPRRVGEGPCFGPRLVLHCGVLQFGSRLTALLSDDTWLWLPPTQPPLQVDFLWVTRGFTGRLPQVTPFFAPRTVLLDASLSGVRRRSLAADCERLGLPVVHLSQGAWLVP